MEGIIESLLGVVGISSTPPTNLYEFIPYFIHLCGAFVLVGWVLSFCRALATNVLGGRL